MFSHITAVLTVGKAHKVTQMEVTQKNAVQALHFHFAVKTEKKNP